MFDDILINYGSEIKATSDGVISGLLVRYSNKNNPDLAGDYFDKDTDFGFEDSIKTAVYLNHRLPMKTADGKEIVVKKKIGEGTLTKSDEGIVIEAILYNRKQYEKALAALGWSSGTAAHLSDRTKVGKAYHIDTWMLGLDASLTPEPCDPDNVCSLKSYSAIVTEIELDDDSDDPVPTAKSIPLDKSLSARLTRLIDDLVEEGQLKSVIVKKLALEALCDESDIEDILSGKTQRPPNIHLKAFTRVLNVSLDLLTEIAGAPSKQTIKGMFADKMAEKVPSRWDLDSVLCQVVKDVATIAKASAATGTEFDRKLKVKEIVAEHATALESLINLQIDNHLEEGSDEPFYLKSVSDLSSVFENVEGLAFNEHSRLVVSALKGSVKRFGHFHQTRLKAGRVLSKTTIDEFSTMFDDIETAVAAGRALIEKAKPMATAEQKNAALSEFMRTEYRLNQLGVTE